MVATLLLHEKRLVEGAAGIGVAELMVWSVPRSKDHPAGRKFRLFFVVEGRVVVGLDDHKPKGPHLHLDGREVAYDFTTVEKLVEDFWAHVRKAGFPL